VSGTADWVAEVDPLNRRLLESYPYARNVPLRGLYIDGRPALSGIDPDRVGDHVVITVRDPLCAYDADPAEQIASKLEDAEPIGRTGMFSSWTGSYRGAVITVVSGGSGSPEAELIMHELLANTSARTFLRVGGSGGMHPKVRPGDLVIARGVVRDEGMTAAYVPPSWPAAADPVLVLALARAAHDAGVPYHVGLIRSTDSDIVGGGRPGVGGYLQPRHTTVVDEWTRAGVLNGDRESAAIVTLAGLFGRRGGSVCSVADNISTGEAFVPGAGHASAIDVALEGLAVLQRLDTAADAAGLPMWLPDSVPGDRTDQQR
jgi:uridine phosphorylase